MEHSAGPAGRLDSFSRWINQGVEYALFGLGFGMAAIVALQVFCRYLLNQSLFWSEELARYMMVWLSFLGASAAYRRGVHPGITVFHRRLPPHLQKGATVFAHVCALMFFAVMIVYGCRFAFFVRLQISPALHLPKWVVFSIVPVSGLLLALHCLAFLSLQWRGSAPEAGRTAPPRVTT